MFNGSWIIGQNSIQQTTDHNAIHKSKIENKQ